MDVLRVCERMGWTLKQWNDLDDQEQIDWLARDYYRRERIDEVLKRMGKDKNLTADAFATLHAARI